MGVVFKAYDPELDRAVALKLLRTRVGASDAAQDRLLREAQALARLQHPNVIAVYDVGSFGRDVFIAMEFVEGQTLRQWLNKSHSRREVLDAYLAAGEGLVAAHRAGLVHRDFKPDNVIVGKDGRVRVLDFGLARAAGSKHERGEAEPAADAALPSLGVDDEQTARDRPSVGGSVSDKPEAAGSSSSASHSSGSLLDTPLTRVGTVVGTPRFMAPEQHSGETADERADQFSFCVALYHSLYDRFPFGGDDVEDALDDMLAEKFAEPPPGATVPRWLRQVLLRGLRARPADRYPSMAALLLALRADPSVAYRRWLRVAALVTAFVGVGLAWRVTIRQQLRVCAGADRKLVGVWDDARRAEVRQAFRFGGKPYAEAALATVEQTLDRYARDWVAMRVDACEATQVRKEQSLELLDLRMACLDDRLTQLSTLSELFSRADDGLVLRAAESAQSLPALGHCADAVALRAPIPPPRDVETRKRVEQIRQQLARAHALALAARYDEALALARAAIKELEVVSYAPAQSAAQLLLGNLLTDRGDFAPGSTALQEAFIAGLAGHDDEAAARTAIQLVHTLGVSQVQHAEGHRWARIAEALIGRVQQRDELGSLLAHKLSMLLQEEGKYDEALGRSRSALELARHLWGSEDLRVGEYYFELGNVYYQQGRYDEALDSYGRSAAIDRKALGPDHPHLAANKFSMANVYGDRGDHKRALAENEQALAILFRVQADHPYVPQILNSMGADLLALGRPKEAFEKFRLAYEHWHKRVGPSADTAMALENMGTSKLELKAPAEALDYLRQALAMCEQTVGTEHGLYAQVLSAMGELYLDEHKPDQALSYFQRSVTIAERAVGKDHPQVASALVGLARAKLALHAAANATAPLERAEAIFEKQRDTDELASARFWLARALWSAPRSSADRSRAMGLAEQARATYEKATGPSAKRNLAEVTAWVAARH
jgi:eukaryotic-like serine/threonine-protein kinase